MIEPWHYLVAMPQPENHLFHIQLTVKLDRSAEYLDLNLPVWSPGSYLVREYAKHLQDFAAVDGDRQVLKWQKVSKNQWRVQGAEIIQVSYKIFANELTVRTNHLDSTHGYFNGAATFMFSPDYDPAFTVAIALPYQNWQIATALKPVGENTFFAENFDVLADSPFEVGLSDAYHCRKFTVLDKPHEFVIWGQGNADIDQIVEDTKTIIAIEAELFGGLPYDRYLFILHLSANSYGGLEHKNCCSLIYPRFNFRKEGYLKFMNLVAHEFFHTWNVKRIRPQALEKIDYNQENYTPSLWFAEGATSYYDQILPLRAGLYDHSHYLKLVSESITRLQTTTGRHVQSLYESSFDTWIKLYRPDPNSSNSQISYYLKGELVAMLLDLLIRGQSQSQRSLDYVMHLMWQYFGKSEIGYTEADLYGVAESVAGTDLSGFFQTYIHSTAELDYNFYLEPMGLEVKSSSQNSLFTGISLKSHNGLATVKSVDFGSPAQVAGVDVGDEVLAINQVKVTAENFLDRLQDFQVGSAIALTIFKQDQLQEVNLVLADPISDRYTISQISHPSDSQLHNLESWLRSR